MAGIFGFFDYSKPGRGVYKNEPKRSRFAQFWILTQRKFWKLIQLNLLYLLFCIPVVTIGPATAGMTYVLREYANERPVFLFSDFWDNFKVNFKQSLIFGLFQIAFTILMVTSIQFYFMNAKDHLWMYATLGLCLMVSLLFTFASYYIYLMIVTLDLPLRAILKNGFIFSILGIKMNFITFFALAVLIVPTVLFLPLTIPLPLFLLFSFCGFIIVYNAYPGIKKYAIDPYLDSLREQNAEPEPEEVAGTIFSDDLKLPDSLE